VQSSAISASRVAVRFKGGLAAAVDALTDLDLAVAHGEIVGILGPNGSGKSTLLRVMAGIQRPTAGTVQVLGRAPNDRALVRRVGYAPEGSLPFPTLSAPAFLRYVGDLMALPAATRARQAELLDRFGLAGAGARRIGTFSTGMARRLALAAALLSDPEVLLLDEPTAGLDPVGSLLAMEVLRERAAAGCAVVLASHHLLEVEQTCSRVVVLDGGRKVAEGSLDELLGSEDDVFAVRGLSNGGVLRVEQAIADAGGQLVARTKHREHLFALFRRLTREPR
jgi:ABC-2 type transport system ATP-binding protein